MNPFQSIARSLFTHGGLVRESLHSNRERTISAPIMTSTPLAARSPNLPESAPQTVLVGFAEAMSAPEVVWSVADHGCKVVAFARKGRRSALRYSRHVTCHEITPPEIDAHAALSELEALCRDIPHPKPLVLFPLDDSAVWLSSRVPQSPDLVLAGPSGRAAEMALDKVKQLDAARQAGFNVPVTRVCATVDDLRATDQALPFIVKPANATWENSGRLRKGGVRICGSTREADAAVMNSGNKFPVLVQPFIPGTGEGLFGLATSSGVRAWSAHERLRMMNPHGSGSSACVSRIVDEHTKAAAERFVAQTGWRGLFMIELLRDRSGTLWFIEFNGRPWGSTALSRRQGFEYPAWQVELALNPESSAGQISSPAGELLTCRHLGREFMHLLFVLRGPHSEALQDWPAFWKALPDVLRVHGRDRWYNWRRDDLKVFVSDCYLTVLNNVFKPRNGQ
jgi:predicted ATP-grasp superfamily ATP-dependent carboligase